MEFDRFCCSIGCDRHVVDAGFLHRFYPGIIQIPEEFYRVWIDSRAGFFVVVSIVLSSQVELDFRKWYKNKWTPINFCSRSDRIQSNTYIHRISTPPPMNPENVVIPQVLDTFRIFDASAGEGSGRPFWGIITRVFLKSHRFQKMLQKPIDF